MVKTQFLSLWSTEHISTDSNFKMALLILILPEKKHYFLMLITIDNTNSKTERSREANLFYPFLLVALLHSYYLGTIFLQ